MNDYTMKFIFKRDGEMPGILLHAIYADKNIPFNDAWLLRMIKCYYISKGGVIEMYNVDFTQTLIIAEDHVKVSRDKRFRGDYLLYPAAYL